MILLLTLSVVTSYPALIDRRRPAAEPWPAYEPPVLRNPIDQLVGGCRDDLTTAGDVGAIANLAVDFITQNMLDASTLNRFGAFLQSGARTLADNQLIPPDSIHLERMARIGHVLSAANGKSSFADLLDAADVDAGDATLALGQARDALRTIGPLLSSLDAFSAFGALPRANGEPSALVEAQALLDAP